ncbi:MULTISPECIES: UDP-2,3-diacylglucosamine diphosphatase [Achromobacter]|uniref:UDP-2,3-diacylglucosamine diphosphatase n=1 Tax=Achromobacter TaxID=222 RepID=UPI00174DD105|nr:MULTISPECIES: UDP-2,3-diacylglucosamine diphosphatase [Achromobacter]
MTTAHREATVTEIQPTHWRALWISDIHLGTAGCKAEFLLDFLDHNDSDTLYLVGDIVDGWQLRKHWHWPRAHNDVIQRILRKARNGTRVVFIPGNHDEFAREFAGFAFGDIEVLDEDVHVTAKGLRLLVLHGDQFDGVIQHSRWLAHLGDGLYQFALWVNHHFNRLRNRLGMHYWSLSQYLKHKVKNAVSFITDFEEALAGEARRRGLDGVVCGHIHKPELRDVSGILYCNDGDWVESLSALAETHDGQLQLLDWAVLQAERQRDPANRPPRSLTLPALPSALRRQGKHP